MRRADGLRRLCSVFADALADEEAFAASLPVRARFTSTGNLFVQVPSPSYPTFRSAVRVVNAYTKNILANPHDWSKAPLSRPPVLELRVAAGEYDLFQERGEDYVDAAYEADWGGHAVRIMATNLHIRGVAREVNGKKRCGARSQREKHSICANQRSAEHSYDKSYILPAHGEVSYLESARQWHHGYWKQTVQFQNLCGTPPLRHREDCHARH